MRSSAAPTPALLLPLLLLVSLVATLLLPAGPAAARGAVVDPMVGAPQRGECYLLTRQQADTEVANPVAARDCQQVHTAWAAGATEVPESIPLSAQSTALQKFASRACGDLAGRYIGSGKAYATSTYLRYVFLPSEELQAQGARWVSCVVAAQKSGQLQRTTRISPLRVKGLNPEPVAACLDAKRRVLACEFAHRYRGIAGTTVVGRMTPERAATLARRYCPRKAGRGYLASTRNVEDNIHVLICWRRTRK